VKLNILAPQQTIFISQSLTQPPHFSFVIFFLLHSHVHLELPFNFASCQKLSYSLDIFLSSLLSIFMCLVLILKSREWTSLIKFICWLVSYLNFLKDSNKEILKLSQRAKFVLIVFVYTSRYLFIFQFILLRIIDDVVFEEVCFCGSWISAETSGKWVNANDFIKINKTHTSVECESEIQSKYYSMTFGGMNGIRVIKKERNCWHRERNAPIIILIECQMLSVNLKWIRFTDCL
jgi:hypothetical protein